MQKRTIRKSYQGMIKSAELYCRIEKLLNDPAVFSDTGLSRKSVSDRLGSNEKYIREAILDHTGLTFSAYITDIRLAYARGLLLCPDHIYSIHEIIHKCGLGSSSTFYRLFKNDCGMTPEEYRNTMYTQESNKQLSI